MPRTKKTNPKAIEVVEDKQEVEKFSTWYSLDKAVGGGLSLYTVDELSGWPSTGKSSICTALAGMINPKGTVLYCSFEPYSSEYIQRGLAAVNFQGKLEIVSNKEKGKPRSPEKMLDEMCNSLQNEEVSCTIWDSIGATPSTAVVEGSVGDANMKMSITTKFAIMKLNYWLARRATPAKAFFTNHVHTMFGTHGTSTNGGMAVQYNTGNRLRMSKVEELDNETLVVQGRIDRLKFKPKDADFAENFWCVIAPKVCGWHPGLTAVIDCEKYGLVERDNGVIKKGKKSWGRLNGMVKKSANDSFFDDFHELLRNAT